MMATGTGNISHKVEQTLRFSQKRRIHHVNRNRQEEEEGEEEDVVVDEAAIENTTVAAATTTPTPTQRTRRFNLLSLLPLTTNPSTDVNGQRAPIPFRIDIEMSAWLAWYHYTNPSSNHHHVLPHIQERLSKCDIDFHFSMRDSKFSALNSANEFYESYNGNSTLRPQGLIGSARSVVSSAINFMASAFNIPQISSGSTAAYLDNKDIYSSFARTIATNAGDANAMALYLNYLNVTHVGIIFINDGYGNDFHSALLIELTSFNISVVSVPYDDLSIEQSVAQLSTSQLKCIIALLNPSNWKTVLRTADQYEIVGRPDYFWIFESLQFAAASFQLDRESEADLARAIHGSAVITVTEQASEPFDLALSNVSQHENLIQLYINQHEEAEIFLNYTFGAPSRSIYQYFTYDAVTAMILAVCETPIVGEEEFSNLTGPRIYNQILRTAFEGVSGGVVFDASTGTRKSEGLIYGVRNIQFPDNLVTGNAFKVLSTLTDVVTLTSSPSVASSSEYIKVVAPFYFASNATVPPLSLPPVDVDLNLIPTAVLAFCLSQCGFVMIMSLFWIYWTFRNREKDVVKASQPIFLCQICVGTFLIASAVIPMSMQEPVSEQGLDISCMATLWLYSIGFVTAFSALFTKTWRLNKVFGSSKKLRRVVVRPRDVALPFVMLLILNIGILMAWTLHSPLVFERQSVDNYDKFGRSVESVGVCVPSNAPFSYIYVSLLAAMNISVLLFANYQAYIGRDLPSKFSESTYIAIAMGSFLEVIVLGIPLLLIASSDTTIRFLIRAVLTIATSLCPLLPIFLPKYFERSINRRYHNAVVAETGASPVQSRVIVSMGYGSKGCPNMQSFDSVGQPTNDEIDESVSGRGTSKLRRNTAFLKEKHIASILKSSVT